MSELKARWENIIQLTKEKYENLQKAYEKSSHVVSEMQDLIKWLTSIDETLQSVSDPQSGKELQALIKKHKVSEYLVDTVTELSFIHRKRRRFLLIIHFSN